jgi:glutamate/tyrosine decarboxylase-like PLP-dependent enzyme
VNTGACDDLAAVCEAARAAGAWTHVDGAFGLWAAASPRTAALVRGIEGVEVVNEVVLNQVLVRVGDAPLTERVERAIQEEGVCWLGATTWRGERLLRISVSNWSTTEADVDRCVEAVGRARAAAPAASAHAASGARSR